MKFKLLTIIVFISVVAISQTNKNYIAIDYNSICCGTPSEIPVSDFLLKFEKQNKVQPFEVFVEYGLGKEGEHVLYIGTDNLNEEKLTIFKRDLIKVVKNQNEQRVENQSGYVNIYKEFVSNSVLKGRKKKPRTAISSLKVYNYKN